MAKKKWGISAGYPRLKKRFGKLTAYISLLRPFTGIAPLLAGLLGTLASINTDFTLEHIKIGIYVGVTLMLSQFCGQVINQYADVELDKIVKPYRPLASGLLTREEALGVGWLLALFSIARGFTISVSFGCWVIALIFFAVFYSLAPFSPRKIHPMLNVLWMAISRGFFPVMAIWGIYGTFEKALPYALLAFIWVLGFQGTKDIEDIGGDKKFGIKTMYSEYGHKGLILWMAASGFAYLVVSAYFKMTTMILLLIIGGFAIYGTTRKSKFTENNYGWMGYYLGLGLLFVLMFLNERLLPSYFL